MLQFADTLSWNHGSHSFQGGFDITRDIPVLNSGGTQTTRPSAAWASVLYRCLISQHQFGGLNASDVTIRPRPCWPTWQATVASISQQYWINTPTDTNWSDYTKNAFFYREHHC